jgi:hypothetical protein
LLAKSPIVGYFHTTHTINIPPVSLTLLLNRVATKAATTTMDTTILTAVETVAILYILWLLLLLLLLLNYYAGCCHNAC